MLVTRVFRERITAALILWAVTRLERRVSSWRSLPGKSLSALCPQFPVVRQCSAESGPQWGLGCPGLAALYWCNVMCNALYSDQTPPRTNPWRQLIPRMYVNWWSDAHLISKLRFPSPLIFCALKLSIPGSERPRPQNFKKNPEIFKTIYYQGIWKAWKLILLFD